MVEQRDRVSYFWIAPNRLRAISSKKIPCAEGQRIMDIHPREVLEAGVAMTVAICVKPSLFEGKKALSAPRALLGAIHLNRQNLPIPRTGR